MESSLAEQYFRLEIAARRIVDHLVLHAVVRVTGLEHRGFDHTYFHRRDAIGGVAELRLDVGGEFADQRNNVRGGRAGDDAVIILWVALRFH